MIPPKRFDIFPQVWDAKTLTEGLDASRFFFKYCSTIQQWCFYCYSNNTIIQYYSRVMLFELELSASLLSSVFDFTHVSRDQILRHVRGQGNIHFPCSADHEQDWQPYPVDPYAAICDDHTYIHTYCCLVMLAVSCCVLFF